MKAKSETYNQNINNRGNVPASLVKKEDKFPVGPVLLGFFLFVVVGSALFQILNTATSNSSNSVY
jgi:Ribosome associated membrane protein RAMP4